VVGPPTFLIPRNSGFFGIPSLIRLARIDFYLPHSRILSNKVNIMKVCDKWRWGSNSELIVEMLSVIKG
jgi:hypothetical protein